MVESYKFKSKLANIIVFLAGLVAYIGVDGLKTIMPVEYADLVPIIVLVAGYIIVQSTENKRVSVAEELVHEEYRDEALSDDDISDVLDDDPVLNDEYTSPLGDDDGGV